MSEQDERGYFLDPRTGDITPVPEAPYGWVIEPVDTDSWDNLAPHWPMIRLAEKDEMEERRYDDDGWPVDGDGKRTDPVGRYLDSLTPEQRAAWGAACSLDAPRIVLEDGRFRTIYPWEPGY